MVFYEPMSRAEHLRRGYCCQSGCLLCPWDFAKKGNPPITAEEIQKYQLSGPRQTRPHG